MLDPQRYPGHTSGLAKYPGTWRCKMTDQWCEFLQARGTTNPIIAASSEIKCVSHDTQHFRCLDVRCLHLEYLGKSAPVWPWQRVTVASFPRSLPFLWPLRCGSNIWDVVDVWAQRNPFLQGAQHSFLKDSTSKMRYVEMTHKVVPGVQTL